MAGIKNITSRIQHKHDTEANWNKAVNFIPLQGEIIVYDIDENVTHERIKVGDGITSIINLPFYLASELDTVLAKLALLEKTVDVDYDANLNLLVFTRPLSIN